MKIKVLCLAMLICTVLIFGANHAARNAFPGESVAPPPQRKSTTKEVSQERLVKFPGIGSVSVRVIEADKKLPRLQLSDSASRKILLTVPVGTPDPERQPLLRFKELSISGLPAPLILAIALDEGASGCRFDAVVIGAVKGRLVLLTQTPLQAGERGGIHVGTLGRGRGSGIAVWNYIWGDREAHADPHRYEVTFYPWSAGKLRFVKGGKLRTRSRHERGEAGLSELKLSFVNLLDQFPDFADCK
jgi:hypothetical protein